MATWVVTGANRGIGLELCRQLLGRGDTVIAACRKRSKELDELGRTGERLRVVDGVDITSDAAGPAIAAALGDGSRAPRIDVLLHNAGVLERDQLATLDFDRVRHQFETNTLGPLRLTKALLPRLERGSKIGLVSSRAGSIGDGPGGAMYGYRLSKAALNMVGANLARDLSERGVLVAVLHPGFIRTEMTGGNGNDDPPVAAGGLIARMDELVPEKSGHFFHANGQELPW
jgi:NAD(P)-dependent dehydrogenase (short-subunit alcohol dehydrogenase family)